MKALVAKVNMFGIAFDNLRMDAAVEQIVKRVEEQGSPAYVVTPNIDHIVKLQFDPLFRELYERASLVLADGTPVVWVSRWLGKPIVEKVSGSDLVPRLFQVAEERKYKVFILGNGARLSARFIHVESYSPPFGFEHDALENDCILERIREFAPDLLFVAVGAPKGEKWIYKQIQSGSLHVPVSLSIGSAIDFMTGVKKRAPQWMQRAGLEWFYRFVHEPRRLFRRCFIDSAYFLIVLMREWMILNREKEVNE